MELLFRHFWIAFIVATVINGRMWWSQVQPRIRANPALGPGYYSLYRGYLFWCNIPWVLMGLGIVSGQVAWMGDFLRPSLGNTFVLAWYGVMGCLLVLGTYWVFVGGGAEMLERHPGVVMVPQWPANKLRLYWGALVIWSVGIATLLFLGFPFPQQRPEGSNDSSSWPWTLFPVFFVAMWIFVSILLAAVGGWNILAKHYGNVGQFRGKRFFFRSAQLGGVSYGSCLVFGASAQGIYLAVLPLFRAGHPPLYFPWSDVSAREAKVWFFPTVELEFSRAPGVLIRISPRLAQMLFRESGKQIVVSPKAD